MNKVDITKYVLAYRWKSSDEAGTSCEDVTIESYQLSAEQLKPLLESVNV